MNPDPIVQPNSLPKRRNRGRGKRRPKLIAKDIEKCRECGDEILSEPFETMHGPLCNECGCNNSYYMRCGY